MARKLDTNVLSGWAFLAGVVLAVILGLGFAGGLTAGWIYVLVIIGLIVGLVNVAGKEVNQFLLSGVVLIIASSLGQEVTQGVSYFNSILQALLAIFVPATIIVAIKNAFSLARK